jgi:uncharacterized protein YgbK (DUF1537 family)
MNAEKLEKRFKGDAITGFDAMTPAERRTAIKDLMAWTAAKRDHAALVASMTALAASLDKTALAHAAFAQGSSEPVETAFAELRAEIRNTVWILQNLHKR